LVPPVEESLPRALVVVPTYDEWENLSRTTRGILAQSEAVAARAGYELEILIVDDDSPDGTGRLADRLAEEDPRVWVLHRSAKEGLGRAYEAGFSWALDRDFACVLEMDADGSHAPEALPELLLAARSADLVLGSRYVPGGGVRNWGLHRRLLSRGGSLYARWVLGLAASDPTGGFRVYTRGLLERLVASELCSGGYAFQVELLWRAQEAGAVIREVPIVFSDRRVGQSKLGWRDVWEAVVVPWRLSARTRGDRRRAP
jgi:dolichol-phosphate mannosyltransferase